MLEYEFYTYVCRVCKLFFKFVMSSHFYYSVDLKIFDLDNDSK